MFGTDDSSVCQRPSSPEKEEESDAQEDEQEQVTDPIANASSGREEADDIAGLDVSTEDLRDGEVTKVLDMDIKPSDSVDEDVSETAA